MPPCPRQKACTQQSSTLGQTVPLPKQHSHSGPSAEEERECFDLDVAGSNNDYDDADNDNGGNNDLAECRPTRARGKPGKTSHKTKVNHPGAPKPANKGPPDIVHFFGDRETRGKPPVTCQECK
jgi:hypothetical protein